MSKAPPRLYPTDDGIMAKVGDTVYVSRDDGTVREEVVALETVQVSPLRPGGEWRSETILRVPRVGCYGSCAFWEKANAVKHRLKILRAKRDEFLAEIDAKIAALEGMAAKDGGAK